MSGRVRAIAALRLILRLGLGALLLVAGALKLGDPTGFAIEVTNYRFLPSLAPYLAVTLPATELLVGAVLIAGTRPWQRAAALLTVALFAVFTVAVAQVVARGINVSCGCFGGDSGPVATTTVLRDVVLVGLSLALYRLTPLAPPTAPRG